MASKPPEVKILGDASGAKKAAQDAASALDDYGAALARAAGLSDVAGDKVDDVDEKISRFGGTADRARGRVGDLGEELKSRLGPAGEFAGGAIDKAVGAIGKMPPAALAAGGGVAALAAGLAALAVSSVNELSDLVGDMEMLRSKSGMTLEEVSRLSYAMERTGVSTDDLDEVMEEWGQGLDENIPKLQAMGVAIARNADGTVNSDQTFRNFLSTLRGVEDPARRLAMAQQLIGESAYRIEPAVRASEQAFQDFYDAADDAGAVVGDIDAATVRELENASKDLSQAWRSLQLSAARSVGPAMADFMGTVAALAEKIAELESKTGILSASMKAVAAPLTAISSGLELVGVKSRDAAGAADELTAAEQRNEQASDDLTRAEQERAAAAEEAEEADRRVKEAVDDARAAIREREQAEKDAEQAIRDRVDAVRASVSADYALFDAEQSVLDAEQRLTAATAKLTETVNTYGGESVEAAAAQREVDQAAVGVERSYISLAHATAEQTIRQAEMNGQMLDSNAKKDILIASLHSVASQMQPGSVPYEAIQSYIAKLQSIPDTVTTRLQVYQDIAPLNVGSNFNLAGLAHGGPARAGEPYIVGEEGPELFVPRSSGTVIPNDALTTGGRPEIGARPWGAPQPLVVKVMVDKREIARAVLDDVRSRS